MKFIPTKDYLLVDYLSTLEMKTQSGLILVKGGQKREPNSVPTMHLAKVLAVGPLARDLEDGGELSGGFEVDEIVAFPPGAEQIVSDGVKDQLLVKATAVVARVEDFSTTVEVLS